MTFNYWLVPLADAVDRTRLCELGQRISAGIQVAQLRPADIAIYGTGQPLPPSASFLRLEGPAVMTSARQVDGALEVRLFNPWEETITALLSTDERPEGALQARQVGQVDFESDPVEEPWAIAGEINLPLKPKEIVTLRIE
jgi:alpha-mannosidase/mannosylglycerate hydrolase